MAAKTAKRRGKSKKAQSTEAEETPQRGLAQKGGEIVGLGLLALSVALFLAVFSFSPADLDGPANVQNLIGPVGAHAADMLLFLFGVGSFGLIGILFLLGGFMLIGRRPELKPSEFVGYALFVLGGAIVCHLALEGKLLFGHQAGGLVGQLAGGLLTSGIGHVGSYILATSLLLLSFMLVTDMSLGGMVLWAGTQVRGSFSGAERKYANWREYRRRLNEAKAELAVDEAPILDEDEIDAKVEQKVLELREKKLGRRAKSLSVKSKRLTGVDDDAPPEAEPEPTPIRHADVEVKEKPSAEWSLGETEKLDSDGWQLGEESNEADVTAAPVEHSAEGELAEAEAALVDDDFGPQIVEAKGQSKKKSRLEALEDAQIKLAHGAHSSWQLPPISYLNFKPTDEITIDREKLRQMAMQLEKTLADFGVQGQVVEICPGPVITMFEFSPKPGVKLSKIAGLSDDLAMALAAISVRIIAPIPGKGVVGIEVPNDYRETVYMKEIVADSEFVESKARLPMALGKDTEGEAVITDLAAMPHLLVAGATGSGKSVAVNTMIVSLLLRFSPDDLRMILVDPKMLEFSLYEGIPHLLLPVVTDPKKAATALRWAVDEMERRYALLAEMGVRNIATYNKRVEVLSKQLEIDLLEGKQDSEAIRKLKIDDSGVPKFQKFPSIVCIIDEFADLMMVASKDVETCVARLAQKARAAGIHVILATQRPSVDVITGLIKANFPTRIALRVAQRTDSRTILDSNGAEHLLGRGDMLFLPPGSSQQKRVHGAFVSEDEIDKIVAHLKEQGEPSYDASLVNYDTEDESKESSSGGDDYDDAVRIVTTERVASISMVQRKLRVGYNRAARMIEKMEEEGIVGPADGSKPRQVLAPPPP